MSEQLQTWRPCEPVRPYQTNMVCAQPELN